jgi:hypothetical protein
MSEEGRYVSGMTFKSSNIKCLSCLYLLHYFEKGRDENGNVDYKIYCMIKDCVKDKTERNAVGT